MRIAQLIDSLILGGAEKLQVTFARTARELGVEVTVIGLYRKPYRQIAEELEEAGARVVMLPGRGPFDPVRAVRLVRLLRRERFDALFTHLTTANVLGPLAARLTGTPCVSTLHNVTPIARRVQAALEQSTLRRLAGRVVAVGQLVAEAQRERLGHRAMEVVPNPVAPVPDLEPEERLAVRGELVDDGHDFIVMSTGSLTRQKAFGDLLAAFAELRRSHPGAALVIAGAGPLEAGLRSEIDALGLTRHATLLGIREDIPRLLAAVDAYASSSHWEGLPLSVLEAMAAGLPVVATAVGDIPNVIVEGTGLVVPPDRPEDLAEALRSVLDDPGRARAMGEAARRHVTAHHSPRAWTERLLEIAGELSSDPLRRKPGRSGS